MKNAQLNASMWMAHHLGIRTNAWKLESKTGMNEDQIVASIMPFVTPALEMYDIAEGVKMGDCSDPAEAFKQFASWFADYMRNNGKVPEDNDAIEMLSNFIFAAFTSSLTSSQDDILRARLAAEVKEYAE